MIAELTWGWPLVVHLFLVGLSTGALTASAYLLLRGGSEGTYFQVARLGAFIAPIPVIVDGFVLIAELGRPLQFYHVFLTITWSPMSIGSWLLLAFIGLSIVYAYTFLSKSAAPGDRWDLIRRALAWIGVPWGIAVAVYPGVMLGAMQARPFWNSPLLPVVFLLSAVAMGLAAIVLLHAVLPRKAAEPEAEQQYRYNSYVLTASNVLVLGGQLLLLLLFIAFAYLTVGSVRHAITVILGGGVLAMEFWVWVVLVGLVLPILVGLITIAPKLARRKEYVVPRAVEAVVPVTVLFGAFMLRYVVVVAGQITGPVGI